MMHGVITATFTALYTSSRDERTAASAGYIQLVMLPHTLCVMMPTHYAYP